MVSHSKFLQLQTDSDDPTASALLRADVGAALIDEKEKALLHYVSLLTNSASETTDEDVQRLRDAGWSDGQIAEAVFVTGLFALFNRVADAFSLTEQSFD